MKRRGLFIGLSVVLAAVTISSLLFTPALSRLQAIPAHAQLIYSKQSPDNLLTVFPNLGKTGSGFPKHWKNCLHTLENYPLTVAAVPFGGRERRDTWVVVSELGAPAAVALRWRMMLLAPQGISPARPYAAWLVWKVEHPSLPSWMKVRFAITEGLLICSISSDSHDIYRLLDTADGRAASRAP
ncbi:MAG: hypothetical protein ISR85_02355 [Kiritimatiellales bacterium]|nr:hypothetical protein [Kiritimatiellota bacterium]MBL7011756.1 hypothetical protein [Kiritimatiellales bacterium]